MDINDILQGNSNSKKTNNKEIKEEKVNLTEAKEKKVNIKDILQEREEQGNIKVEKKKDKEKSINKKRKKNNKSFISNFTPLKYILATSLDFIVFGIIYLILINLVNIPLAVISKETGRVIVINSITIIVFCNLLLLTYFYFYAKEHEGSTPMMRIFKIGIQSKKGTVTLITSLMSNVNFWIYFVLIDLVFVNTIDGMYINVYSMSILILQLVIMLLLIGCPILKIKIINKEKNEEVN